MRHQTHVQITKITHHLCHDSTDYPSHGGAYMVEGCLSLGSDWLAVVQSLDPSYIAAHCTSTLLRFSLGLLWTAYLPVMTTARIASLVMDSYLVALYQVYDSDSFLGSL